MARGASTSNGVFPELTPAERAATERLVEAILSSKEATDPNVVRACVKDGARLVRQHHLDLWKSPLTTLIEWEAAECAVICLLEAEQPIDFTAVDSHADTLLHLTCKCSSKEAAKTILTAAIQRIREKRPGDAYDFSLKNCDGLDFLSCAGASEMLHVAWPLVKDFPFYAQRSTGGIQICAELTWSDWMHLRDDHWRFKLMYEVCDPTLTLFGVSNVLFPHAEDAQSAVDQGANVLFRKSLFTCPILHYLVYRELVDCFAVCMNTREPIDFTVLDHQGNNPLHIICLGSVGKAKAMLAAVVHRLLNHPEDKVDWEQLDGHGDDFLHGAQRTGMILSFWPILKALPYFQHMALGGIPFTQKKAAACC